MDDLLVLAREKPSGPSPRRLAAEGDRRAARASKHELAVCLFSFSLHPCTQEANFWRNTGLGR